MNLVTLPGATPCVTPALTKFLSRLDRTVLEPVADAAIQLLDDLDGDADHEPDDDDRCTAADDIGTAKSVTGSDDGIAGEPDDAYDESPGESCGHYGLNQINGMGPNAAFASLNEMTAHDIAAMVALSPRQRLGGRLSLRMGSGQ